MGKKSRAQRLNYSVLNSEGFGTDEEDLQSIQYPVSPVKTRSMRRQSQKKVDGLISPGALQGQGRMGVPAADTCVAENVVQEAGALDDLETSNRFLNLQIAELEEQMRVGALLAENKRLQERLSSLISQQSGEVPESGCSGVVTGRELTADISQHGRGLGGNLCLANLREVSHLELLAEKQLRSQGLSSVGGEQTNGGGHFSGLDNKALKGKKSGLDLVRNECIVLNTQRCPHTHLKHEYAASIVKYRDLTLRLFVAGELEIIALTVDMVEKLGRQNFLQKMMYHAGKYEWDCLLDLYAAVIKSIESGEKSWDDNFQDIEHMILSLRPVSRVGHDKSKVWASSAQKSTGTTSRSHRVMFCAPFQSGDCKEGEVHQASVYGKKYTVRHICAKCWMNDKEMRSHNEASACCPFLGKQN